MVNWGNGAKGAVGGAAIGATFGPWGAGIGGVAGGLLGLFGGDDSSGAPPPVNLPYFEQDREKLNQALDGQSAFAGSEWGGLISQLQARASGNAPSVAGNAYKQASQDAQNGLASLSQNSASPGAARQAILQAGHIQQGMAQGYGAAALQEQQANQGALGQALSARDQINSQAYQGLMGQQLGLSRSEMGAMQGNQGAALQEQQIQTGQQAAQWAAYAGLAAGLGKIYGTGGTPTAANAAGGVPITSPSQLNTFGKYQRNYSDL